jgi:O-acetyl-ADP-ribose deacetylase (regulator of RNase III)
MERIQIVHGDITGQQVDAIVNAANSSLLGGGGVDGAIHRAAGPELLEECRKLGGCPTSESRITRGYKLPAKYVIHTVGPVWRGGKHNEPQLLASCYRTALDLARQNNCDTVAFPAISCGAYGYPLDLAARTSVDVVRQYLEEHDRPGLVRWVLFDAAAYEAWRAALE